MKAQDHDVVLDGLRGFAALAVLVYHLGHWFTVPRMAAGAGLAVDFFFCLSGYVLAMVYRQRLDANWGLSEFFKARLIRSMPLIILGTLISAFYVAFRMLVRHQAEGHEALSVATMLGLANLPYLSAPKMIGGPQVFPLNGPQYSLFLEILVNALWASSMVLRGRVASFTFLIVGLLGVALFGLGGDETATFWTGLPRVLGSFYLGTLAFDAGPWIRARLGHLFPGALVATAILFFWPQALPLPVKLLWIAVLSPFLVVSGAGFRLPEQARPAMLMLGRLSYPVYALQYPLFCWLNGLVQMKTHRQIPEIEIPMVLIAVPLLAWLLLVLYDEPLREALKGRSQTRRQNITPAPAGSAPPINGIN
jgi:peptidoglycan/LPS O-acetylase OafA/YrhL